MRASNTKSRRDFTLIELLVVVGVMALLISLLLPALRQAQLKARQISCANNLRQLGQCVGMYLNDYAGNFPGGDNFGTGNDGWEALESFAEYIPGALHDGQASLTHGYPNYLATTNLLLCPDANSKVPFYSYGWNAYLVSRPCTATYGRHPSLASIRSPSELLFMADAKNHTLNYWDYTDNGSGVPAHFAARHSGAGNTLFIDGHTNPVRKTLHHPELFYQN